jgi:hypothetical protein
MDGYFRHAVRCIQSRNLGSAVYWWGLTLDHQSRVIDLVLPFDSIKSKTDTFNESTWSAAQFLQSVDETLQSD